MADRHTTVFGDQIDLTALGVGLAKDANDNLKVYVDDVTIETAAFISGGSEGIQVKDAGITAIKLAANAVTEDKLDALDSPANGEVLAWNSGSARFEWVSNVMPDTVMEADVICNEIPTGTIGSGNVTFNIANAPVAGTVEVYLNGLLQAPGVGLDYTIAGQVITFVKAPKANSDLYVSYIINN